MKKIVGLLVVLFLCGGVVNAQKLKLGHVNTGELMQQLMEKDSVQFQLQQLQLEMQQDLQKKQLKLDQDIQEYYRQKDSLSKVMVKMKEEAIKNSQQELQVLPQQYEQAFQVAQQDLILPIRKKLDDAIKKIAAAGAYNYVFDSATLLYTVGGNDLTQLVRTELGLPTPTATPAAIPGQ